MTAGQQLERSVLESKERDELHAIAQAMSLKTTSRTKKADIIDQILEATGVTGEDSPNGATTSNGGSPGRSAGERAGAGVEADAAPEAPTAEEPPAAGAPASAEAPTAGHDVGDQATGDLADHPDAGP